MPASPQDLAFRESLQQNVPCNMTSTLGHCSPVPEVISGPMPTARANSRDRPVHLQDQQRQVVTPFCPLPPEWLQMQDAHLRALREELQACRMAVQAEALERRCAVAQVERTLKALMLVETEERKATTGALHADLRVTDARLHELLNALEKGEKAKAQPTSTDLSPHQAKSRHVSPRGNHQTQEQVASTLTTPVVVAEAEAEADAEADVHHPVQVTGAVLVDELAMTVAELHADLLNDLRGTLKTQLRELQQGLWQALDHEMSERKQFENRTIYSFETLKESLQSPLDEMQEDLAKRARERAQKAWEQFASDPAATTSQADMVAQAAQAARTAASAMCMDDTVPVVPLPGGKHSQQPAQAPKHETEHEPAQQLVSMEDTHACGGGDGAAGPRHPMGLKAQTVRSTQLKCTAEPPVPCQDDSTVRSLAISASDPSGVPMQSREALNSEAQVAPESSCTDNSDLARGKGWRARYQEINQRIESGCLNQSKAVELALRALSVEEAPGVSRPLDSDDSLPGCLFTGRLPLLPDSDNSTLAQSSGFVSGRIQVPNRYLLRRSIHGGPEITATAESLP